MAEKPSVGEAIKALFGLAVLVYVGKFAYDNYLKSDDPPIQIGSEALTEHDLAYVVSASKTNEVRFRSEYMGRAFTAVGQFKEANKDLSRYHIAVTVGYSGEVSCETNDQTTLSTVSRLAVGDKVRISGLIDDTWMGGLQLTRCSIQR